VVYYYKARGHALTITTPRKSDRLLESALSFSPSIPIGTGGDGLMPDELGDSAPPGNESSEELSRWAEEFKKHEQQQESASLSSPSVPIVTGGDGRLPDQFDGHLPDKLPIGALVTVTEVPSDAISFPYNGQNILVPPDADFEKVYNAGVSNGRFNIGGIYAAVGHFGTFDYQRNKGLGRLGESSKLNYFYPSYINASNFAVGVFMAGAEFS
jgi:hypothetical protein